MYRPSTSRIRHERCAPVFAALALATMVGGCSAFTVPPEPPRPTPADPVISTAELEGHLEFLNGEETMGRGTGTQGYARAAAYVAARMNEFRLQPAVEGEFRVVYGASINYPVSSTFRMVGETDSVAFLPGIDFLPDSRSDSGSVRLSRLVVADEDPSAPTDPFAVVLRRADLSALRMWRDAGARLVINISDLSPRFYPAPVAGLIVLNMTPRGVGLLLGVPEDRLEDYLAAQSGTSLILPREMVVRVATEFQPQAGAINIMGYFSGKDPTKRSELVIVCADLDAVGHVAGVRTLDFRNFGISTAAVLEAARNMSYVTRRWSVPDRSVMVAVWSGSEQGHEGLRYFLENPTWRPEKIVSIVYLGLERRNEADVRRLLADYGIPLTAIYPSTKPLYPKDLVFLPDPAALDLAEARDGEGTEVDDVDLPVIVDSAVVRAAAMARQAYLETLVRTTDPATFFPVGGDSLPVPTASGIE